MYVFVYLYIGFLYVLEMWGADVTTFRLRTALWSSTGARLSLRRYWGRLETSMVVIVADGKGKRVKASFTGQKPDTPLVVVHSVAVHARLFVTPWTAAHQASLSFTISQSLLKLMSIELVMPSNHLILCHPLLLLPSIFPSIRDFSSELTLPIRWPKDWNFSFSISPSNEYSRLISFRFDWFDFLAVQETTEIKY